MRSLLLGVIVFMSFGLMAQNDTLACPLFGKSWEKIKRIEGSGNSSSQIKYRVCNRAQKNAINYYRLSQMGYDGKKEVFEVLAIKNENVLKHVYDMESGNIVFDKVYGYELYNSMGQIVLKGRGSVVFVEGLSSGVYFLRTGDYTQSLFIN